MGNTGWMLTTESWGRLLAALDADQAQAAMRYESLRQKLIKFFEYRGALSAPDLADVTIDRVARKLEQGEVIESITSYSYGVARLVLLEHFNRQLRREKAIDTEIPAVNLGPDGNQSGLSECLTRCLARLPNQERSLLLEYYADEKKKKIDNRKELAESLGISVNHLRIKVHRLRAPLEACVRKCMDNHTP